MKIWIVIIGLTAMACRPLITKPVNNTYITQTQASDQSVIQKIKPYKDSLDAYMNEIIGTLDVDMERKTKSLETKLGNFVVDLAFKYAVDANQKIPDKFPKPDMAILNFGGLRTSWSAGSLSRRDVYELMPFENNLVVITMNTADMKALFTYLATHPQPIANAKLDITNNMANNISINQTPLENRTYYVITSDYLGNGGDQMTFFKEKPQIAYIKLRDVIMQHIEQSKEQISSSLEGRISLGK